jgi:hypothetical protein
VGSRVDGSVVGVTGMVAEGTGRRSDAEKNHFFPRT